MILLDTNILIDLNTYTFAAEETYTASILSRAELELGVHRAPDAATRSFRQNRLRQLDDAFDWLLFDKSASLGYGVVAGATTISGARLRNKDALIAGQAYSLGLPLMTRNTNDFAPFSPYIVILDPR